MIQYPRAWHDLIEIRDYWMPAFAGMTAAASQGLPVAL
jgi:hypothetical protein